MNGQISINLLDKIESIAIIDSCPASVENDLQLNRRGNDSSGQRQFDPDSSVVRKDFSNACAALNKAAVKLQEHYDKSVKHQTEGIVRLAVEIARKILMKKVEANDYDISAIVGEVLKNAPTHQDVTVHLNPDDLEQCQKFQNEDNSILAGVKLVADSNINRAECVLKTPKGTIYSLIDEHLDSISDALGKVK